eukprot:362754-Chlamydomonas_euryale.AAC.5
MPLSRHLHTRNWKRRRPLGCCKHPEIQYIALPRSEHAELTLEVMCGIGMSQYCSTTTVAGDARELLRKPRLRVGADLATSYGSICKPGTAGVCWQRCTVLALPGLGLGYLLEKNALLGCPNLLIYVDIPRSGTRTWGRVLRSKTTDASFSQQAVPAGWQFF